MINLDQIRHLIAQSEEADPDVASDVNAADIRWGPAAENEIAVGTYQRRTAKQARWIKRKRLLKR